MYSYPPKIAKPSPYSNNPSHPEGMIFLLVYLVNIPLHDPFWPRNPLSESRQASGNIVIARQVPINRQLWISWGSKQLALGNLSQPRGNLQLESLSWIWAGKDLTHHIDHRWGVVLEDRFPCSSDICEDRLAQMPSQKLIGQKWGLAMFRQIRSWVLQS